MPRVPYCLAYFLALFFIAVFPGASRAQQPIADTPFTQHKHLPYPGLQAVRAVAASGDWVYMGTDDGLYVMEKGRKEEPYRILDEPVHSLVGGAPGERGERGTRVSVLTPDQQYYASANDLKAAESFTAPLLAYACSKDRSAQVLAGMILENGKSSPVPLPGSVNDAIFDRAGTLWIATDVGLYAWRPDAPLLLLQSAKELLSAYVESLALDSLGRVWAGGLGGITVLENGQRVRTFTPSDGLPSIHVTALATGPDGEMWAGTADNGAAYWDGETWSVRQSRRWLLSDTVNDIAFDGEGTAWIATEGGLSAITRTSMTLAEKAAYFQEVTEARHVREPFIVEKCFLETPGDLSTWRAEDDDNDGSYTALYMIAEAYRWKVTGDPAAREHARRAWDFLVELQEVTGTEGFVARTIIPADWDHMHDPNRSWSEEEKQLAFLRDPRFKPVEDRWNPTADGKWLWKRDTSSDEITGHFYAFHKYYDLVASEEEKPAVRAHVRKVMDYIIDGGYNLMDIDGRHTRWGVWAPEKLNGDPDWQAERGINSLELISYLKTTHHITGDDKYARAYRELIDRHGYAENARHAKTLNPAWVTHIDTELLNMTYPGIVPFEADETLAGIYRESLDRWFRSVREEQNAYATFTYAALTEDRENLQSAVDFLRDTPLDLVNWHMDLRKREDLKMVREPIPEFENMDRLVPVDERHVVRWDKNPWRMQAGDGGRTEWAPTFWLLPYWMGRYYGFIDG